MTSYTHPRDQAFFGALAEGLNDADERVLMLEEMPLTGVADLPADIRRGFPAESVMHPTLRLGRALEAAVRGANYPPRPREVQQVARLVIGATLLENELRHFEGPEVAQVSAAAMAGVVSVRIAMWDALNRETALLQVEPHEDDSALSAGLVIDAATQLLNILQS